MRFKFTLQKVLELRIEKEDALQKEREEIVRVLTGLRNLLQDELQCYFDERERFNQSLRDGLILGLPLLEKGLEFRKMRMVEVLSRVRQVESELAEMDKELLQARKDVKTVEKLREKKEEEFLQALEAKEKKMLDEMAVLRHSRRERDGL